MSSHLISLQILKEDRDKLTSFNDEYEKLTSFTDRKEYGTNNSLKPSDEKSITPPTVVISNVDTMKVGRDTSLEQTMEDQIPQPGNHLASTCDFGPYHIVSNKGLRLWYFLIILTYYKMKYAGSQKHSLLVDSSYECSSTLTKI